MNNQSPEQLKGKEKEQGPDKFAPERQKIAEDVVKDGTNDKLNEFVKARDKQELIDLMKKDNLDFKNIEDIDKATQKYASIMDKRGVDTVLGRLPGGDFASSAFSTLYFLYQGQKLPSGEKLGIVDTLKIFGLQVIDGSMGTAAKVVGAGGGAITGALIGTVLMPIVGTIAGGVVGGVGGYIGGGTLFDYFFKANKWSANIFQKHCDTLKNEAKTRKNKALYTSLETESVVISNKFSDKNTGKERLKLAA